MMLTLFRHVIYCLFYVVFITDGFAFSQEEHGAVLQVCVNNFSQFVNYFRQFL